ncbi:Uncharacterized conserved protein, DUF1330 family [Jannaschia faecimaris]|uniref:Uncharacterized conserved protein, DUF1330 family n=1 Tax=Jannaschia faecimaris TaxID=1244108 RepID=A0A1H3U271_9RHOB|nr:DUF1330 domain-containing protein [Jannaschia faecimaris]SDZ56556.1 Uncharacterized conserved protein, DUF1330 family [Jannaschia faecimaris]
MVSFITKIAVAAVAFAVTVAPAVADPVYMIAQVKIEDQESYFDDYGTAVFPIVMGTGAKVLVATPTVKKLEGEWDGNWTVVIEFPSESAAMDDWYNSAAYESVRELRFATTSLNNLVIAPGFVPVAQ